MLSLTKLELHHFRSYDQFLLERLGPLTIFIGNNAVGKTNLIEAIQLLTAATSFRHPQISQMVKWGESEAKLQGVIEGDGRRLDVQLHMTGHSKKFSLNGNRKKAVDFMGTLPSVVFTPDDLQLVKGPSSLRRRSLDALGCQLSRNHYLISKDYEKVIQHKNKLLKEGADSLLLESVNEMLTICGSQLIVYRAALAARFFPLIEQRYSEIAGGELAAVKYLPLGEGHDELHDATKASRDQIREYLAEQLAAILPQEIARGRSLVGPHCDKIMYSVNGMPAADFASQGQQRSLVLAEKLAEVAMVEDVLHVKPVLLLDDVMSELDGDRRRAILNYINQDVQTFITTTHLEYFEPALLESAELVKLGSAAKNQ